MQLSMTINDRLSKFIEFKGLSANELSKIIGVQRSTLSHILTGRNTPSIDLIERFYTAFPEVSLVWLINGAGEMFSAQGEEVLSEKIEIPEPKQLQKEPIKVNPPEATPKTTENIYLTAEHPVVKEEHTDTGRSHNTANTSAKEKIAIQTIITYNDGTFDIFRNSHL